MPGRGECSKTYGSWAARASGSYLKSNRYQSRQSSNGHWKKPTSERWKSELSHSAAALVASGPSLLVGSTSLTKLYEFLKGYRNRTQDLDQLYEKNVRCFLGARGKVNKVMQETLRSAPEQFGLYNNGITIVVTDFETAGEGNFHLVDPYIVNGCQTTRTVWEVCHAHLELGRWGPIPRWTIGGVGPSRASSSRRS